MEVLKKGQVVYLDNKKYIVVGKITFYEEGTTWSEYKVVPSDNKFQKKWLTIEENDFGITEYSLFEDNYSFPGTSRSMTLTINCEEYELYESGTATVKNQFGAVDVDFNEKVNYYEYICKNNEKKRASIEDWNGEIEKSVGEILEPVRVKISDEIDNETLKSVTPHLSGAAKFWAFFLTIGIYIIPLFLGLIGSLNQDSILSYCKKNTTKYEYVTSVTNNENNKKAKVYKAKSLTVEQTASDIIKGTALGIEDIVEDTDETTSAVIGIGIRAKSEYAYIYESEDGEDTLVQVSKTNYVTSNASTYNSRYRTHYYRTFSRRGVSNNFSSILSSARQSSINSRKSSGGGLSSGK